MLIERVIESLKNTGNFDPNTKILLGFSGGADSICLLDILSKIGFQINIAYFNHQLRAGVDEEIQFVKNTADKYKLDFIIGSENISVLAEKGHQGIEEAARFYRYQFLFKTAKESNARGVFVAHHADDQAETILMNIIRGTGLNGLIGMKLISSSEFSDSIPIIRPMLNIWKDEILLYCRDNQLPFMVDETNKDENFKRNRIRGNLIPTLERYNPKIKQGLIRMGTILHDDYEFLVDFSENALNNVVQQSREGFVKIDVLAFSNCPVSIQRNIVNQLLHDFFNTENNTSFDLVENIRKVLIGEKASKYSKIMQDLNVLVEKGSGYLFASLHDLLEENDLYLLNENSQIKKQGVTIINDFWCITSEILPVKKVESVFSQNKNMYIAYLDANSVGEQLFLQKWHKGIRFAPLGLSGHSMKLSDFWINKGLPKRKRDNWPLVIS
ncbi:MAG: tRNA lysidine(34) synthetase TilS, partial [Candidatus Lokiarchaeota archaeon]|nr:tRNA lysidine(34) synthetase TilS [Candidatus Lokiarchaeota archaeon]